MEAVHSVRFQRVVEEERNVGENYRKEATFEPDLKRKVRGGWAHRAEYDRGVGRQGL